MTLNENFTILSSELLMQLSSDVFSSADIFWQKKFGNPVCLIKSGGLLDERAIKKIRQLQDQLSVNIVTAEGTTRKFHRLWTKLDSATSVDQEVQAANMLISFFTETFLKCPEQYSRIDLINLGVRCFSHSTKDEIIKHATISIDLMHRNALAAFLVTISALMSGYHSPSDLRQVYASVLWQDAFLMNDYAEWMQLAIAKEIEEGGAGALSLLEASQDEMLQKFSEHVELPLIENPELRIWNEKYIRLINIHHERLDGSGFPKNLTEDSLSDIELYTLFFCGSLPLKEMAFMQSDLADFFKELFSFDIPKGIEELWLSPFLKKGAA